MTGYLGDDPPTSHWFLHILSREVEMTEACKVNMSLGEGPKSTIKSGDLEGTCFFFRQIWLMVQEIPKQPPWI